MSDQERFAITATIKRNQEHADALAEIRRQIEATRQMLGNAATPSGLTVLSAGQF